MKRKWIRKYITHGMKDKHTDPSYKANVRKGWARLHGMRVRKSAKEAKRAEAELHSIMASLQNYGQIRYFVPDKANSIRNDLWKIKGNWFKGESI